MKKIPTLFQRASHWTVRDAVTPGCEWVFEGQGIGTRKLDGTCCMTKDGALYKRRTLRGGVMVANFIPATGYDPKTRKQEGWVPVWQKDRYHLEAWAWLRKRYGQYERDIPNDTWELIGPKVQGNPEGALTHILVSHGSPFGMILPPVPVDFDGLKQFLAKHDIEGIVWHHLSGDGRMAKIKGKDFGLKRPTN